MKITRVGLINKSRIPNIIRDKIDIQASLTLLVEAIGSLRIIDEITNSGNMSMICNVGMNATTNANFINDVFFRS